MALSSRDTSAELRSIDDLLAPFFEAQKPRDQFRIGAEAEKFGVDRETGAPMPFEGERSIGSVLELLADRHGWTRDGGSGPLISLLRDGASVTLEPGAQLELSGAPMENIHQVCAEMNTHLAELRAISEELRAVWLGIGFHPFARQADLPWVPKTRYGIMRRYLPTRGAHGLDMMRRTATVQANFDYESEESAMRSLRVALKLSPIVTAMFANSPFVEGRPFGGKSYRARVWLSVDPDRQGLLPKLMEPGCRFLDYVEWALDAPMFVVLREGAAGAPSRVLENTGQTFRSYLAHGFQGERATMGDWLTHINTVFPEVRLKRTIEVRGADSLPWRLACGLPALWTGILYEPSALDRADELTRDLTFAELEAVRPEIAQRGTEATLRGRPLWELAHEVLEIASHGLGRRARHNRLGEDETLYLSAIRSLIDRRKCPADVLLEAVAGVAPGPEWTRVVLERAQM